MNYNRLFCAFSVIASINLNCMEYGVSDTQIAELTNQMYYCTIAADTSNEEKKENKISELEKINTEAFKWYKCLVNIKRSLGTRVALHIAGYILPQLHPETAIRLFTILIKSCSRFSEKYDRSNIKSTILALAGLQDNGMPYAIQAHYNAFNWFESALVYCDVCLMSKKKWHVANPEVRFKNLPGDGSLLLRFFKKLLVDGPDDDKIVAEYISLLPQQWINFVFPRLDLQTSALIPNEGKSIPDALGRERPASFLAFIKNGGIIPPIDRHSLSHWDFEKLACWAARSRNDEYLDLLKALYKAGVNLLALSKTLNLKDYRAPLYHALEVNAQKTIDFLLDVLKDRWQKGYQIKNWYAFDYECKLLPLLRSKQIPVIEIVDKYEISTVIHMLIKNSNRQQSYVAEVEEILDEFEKRFAGQVIYFLLKEAICLQKCLQKCLKNNEIHTDMVSMLLQRGDWTKYTGELSELLIFLLNKDLHYDSDTREVIKLLLKHGADPFYHSAYGLAHVNGDYKLMKLFKRYADSKFYTKKSHCSIN